MSVFRRGGAFVIAVMVLALTASIASADGPGWTTVAQFPGPAFGVNAGPGDSLLVAGPEGPVKLDPDDGDTELIASIPGVSDVIQTGPPRVLPRDRRGRTKARGRAVSRDGALSHKEWQRNPRC